MKRQEAAGRQDATEKTSSLPPRAAPLIAFEL